MVQQVMQTALEQIRGGATTLSPEGLLQKKKLSVDDVALLAGALKVNCTLTSIIFGLNSIGDEGAKAVGEALKVNRTLTSVNLTNNSIGDEGAKAIGEALKVNSTLTSIDLSQNWIGDDGAAAIGEALKVNSTLTSIDLGDNRIGAEGAKAIGEALKVNSTLTSIHLTSNSIGSHAASTLASIALLSETSALDNLDLSHNPAITSLDTLLERIVDSAAQSRSPKSAEINFKGCVSLTSPPYGLVDTPDRFRSFVCNIASQGLDTTVRRRRLVFVGHGGIGKTTLAGLLTDPKTEVSTDSASKLIAERVGSKYVSTHGIETTTWSPERDSIGGDHLPPANRPTFAVYDFAGQMEYFSLHQHFLPKDKAVYVVMFRATDPSWEHVLYLWLGQLQTQIGAVHLEQGSVRVLVVGTHFDRLTARERTAFPSTGDIKAVLADAYPALAPSLGDVFALDYGTCSDGGAPSTQSLEDIYAAIVAGAIESTRGDVTPFAAGIVLRHLPMLALQATGGVPGALAIETGSAFAARASALVGLDVEDELQAAELERSCVMHADNSASSHLVDRLRRVLTYVEGGDNADLRWERDYLHATGDILSFPGTDVVVSTPQQLFDVAVRLVDQDAERRALLAKMHRQAAPAEPLVTVRGCATAVSLARLLCSAPHGFSSELAATMIDLFEKIGAIHRLRPGLFFVPMSLPIIVDSRVFDPSLFSAGSVAYRVTATKRGNVMPLGAFADIQLRLLRRFGKGGAQLPLIGSNVIRVSLEQARERLTVQIGMDSDHGGLHVVVRDDGGGDVAGAAGDGLQLASSAVRTVVEAVVAGVVGQDAYDEFYREQQQQSLFETPRLADLLTFAGLGVTPTCAACLPDDRAARGDRASLVFDELRPEIAGEPVCATHAGAPTRTSLALPWLEAADRAAHEHAKWLAGLPRGSDNVPADVPTCSILRALPRDPVRFRNDATACVFERFKIEQWLARNGLHPLTRLPATIADVVPDPEAKARVDAFLARLQSAAESEANAERQGATVTAPSAGSAPLFSMVHRANAVGEILTGPDDGLGTRSRALAACDRHVRAVVRELIADVRKCHEKDYVSLGAVAPERIEASTGPSGAAVRVDRGQTLPMPTERAEHAGPKAADAVHVKRIVAFLCLGDGDGWEDIKKLHPRELAPRLVDRGMLEAADMVTRDGLDTLDALEKHPLLWSMGVCAERFKVLMDNGGADRVELVATSVAALSNDVTSWKSLHPTWLFHTKFIAGHAVAAGTADLSPETCRRADHGQACGATLTPPRSCNHQCHKNCNTQLASLHEFMRAIRNTLSHQGEMATPENDRQGPRPPTNLPDGTTWAQRLASDRAILVQLFDWRSPATYSQGTVRALMFPEDNDDAPPFLAKRSFVCDWAYAAAAAGVELV